MSVLRRNKDSLMAVLEAFVYDPLLYWRLMEVNIRSRSNEVTSMSAGSGQDVGDLSESLSINVSKKGTGGGVSGTVAMPAASADGSQPEAVNKKAIQITARVRDKLTGNDFPQETNLEVKKQVDLLIQQATSNENLCQCYIGWCPFW